MGPTEKNDGNKNRVQGIGGGPLSFTAGGKRKKGKEEPSKGKRRILHQECSQTIPEGEKKILPDWGKRESRKKSKEAKLFKRCGQLKKEKGAKGN